MKKTNIDHEALDYGPLYHDVLINPADMSMYASRYDCYQYDPKEEGVLPGSVSDEMYDALCENDCRIDVALEAVREEQGEAFVLEDHIYCTGLDLSKPSCPPPTDDELIDDCIEMSALAREAKRTGSRVGFDAMNAMSLRERAAARRATHGRP